MTGRSETGRDIDLYDSLDAEGTHVECRPTALQGPQGSRCADTHTDICAVLVTARLL